MNDQAPKRRWFAIQPGLGVPKNAVAVGIIIGGILGSTLALLVLRAMRPAGQDTDPAELIPIRAVPPRPQSSSTAPTNSGLPQRASPDTAS